MGTIPIRCDGVKTFVPQKNLSIFQGDLKTLTPENLAKLKARIMKVGWKYPLFVWKNAEGMWVLDGTERLLAARSLERDGHTVPPLPVVFIEARTKKEAKEEVLHLSSAYGEITKKGLSDFVGDMHLDLGTISIDGIQLERDTTAALDPQYGADLERKETLKPYRFQRVLISFPPAIFRKVRAHLDAIARVKGVEIDTNWS